MAKKKFKVGKHLSFQWNKSQSVLVGRLGFGKELNRASAEIFSRYMYQYISYDTGDLSNSTVITATKDRGQITYRGIPYANYQHNAIDTFWNRNRSVHPLATSQWDVVCWNNDKYKITADINNARKRLAKK